MSVEKTIRLNGLNKLVAVKTSRRVMLMALLVIATMALYRWILAPYGGQLLAAQKYDFVLDSVLRKAAVLNTTLEKKTAKLAELAAQAETLRNEIFTPDELRVFFTSLPALAKRDGCVIQSINTPSEQKGGPVIDGSGIIEKKAVVTFVGGYGNIMALIKDLQTGWQKVWIDSVRMDTGTAGKLKCQLTLTVYCADSMERAFYE